MKKLLGALAGIALVAPLGTVLAADLRVPVKAPMMAPVAVYNWTGFYAGVNVGYSWGRDPYDIAGASTTRTRVFRAFGLPAETLISDVTAAGPAFAAAGTANIDGFVGGGQMGYNWQTGGMVWGLETDIQWTGQKGSSEFCLTAGCPLGSFTANADYRLRWFGTFRARAGVLVDPRVLLYVTGGLAYGEINVDYTAGILGLPLGSTSTSTVKAGWTIGGGIEGALGGNWTAKAEYLYMDLGTQSVAGLGGVGSTIIPNAPQGGFTTVVDTTFAAAANARIRDNIFRVGLNYRFAPEVVVARY
jgi:outer membrane immunogenic protein